MNSCTVKALMLPLAFLGLVLASTPGRADRALLPLGQLIDMAEIVVVAKVTKVIEGSSRGEQIATLEGEQWLKGTMEGEVSVLGSTLDPGFPHFTGAEQVLAFLKTGEGATHVAVEGDHGIMEIAKGSVPSTVELVKSAMDPDPSRQMDILMTRMRADAPPPPRVLEASYLEELTVRVTAEQAGMVKDLACDQHGKFSTAAREWAVTRAGALKVGDARECLESVVRGGSNPRLRIAAIEALGEIGDPASAPVLKSLIPELEPEPGTVEGAPIEGSLPKEEEQDAARQGGADDGHTSADQNTDPEDEGIYDADLRAQNLGGESAATWGEGRAADGEPPPDDDSGVDEAADESEAVQPFNAAETESALLALGKIGAAETVPTILRFTRISADPALQSTAVHALGLVGSAEAIEGLAEMGEAHASELIRDQAMRTKARLEATKAE